MNHPCCEAPIGLSNPCIARERRVIPVPADFSPPAIRYPLPVLPNDPTPVWGNRDHLEYRRTKGPSRIYRYRGLAGCAVMPAGSDTRQAGWFFQLWDLFSFVDRPKEVSLSQ